MDAVPATSHPTPADELHGQKNGLLKVVLFVLLLGFGFQGSRHLWQPDEGYNAAVTCEMIDSGDLLVQHLDGLIYLGKPPMYIWCTVPGIWIFGRNEFGLRAFCGLCYVLTTLCVYLTGAAMWKRREGILAALIYATMLMPFGAANVARPDAPLVLATAATLYCFWRSVMPNATHTALWKMLMCAVIGWGFEIKATAALVPAAPMFVYLLLTRQTVSYFATLWSLVGLLIFVAVGLSWYVYTAETIPRSGPYLWDSLVVGRLVADTYGRNPSFLAGVQLYVPALLAGTFPWLPFWLPLYKRIQPARAKPRWFAELRSRPRALLLVLWIVLPLVVYFAASSKLILYLLPVFPPFALLTARALTEFMPELFAAQLPRRSVWIAFVSWGVILLGVRFGAAYWPTSKDEGLVWQSIREKLPANCSRIVVVNEDLDGLRFYSNQKIMRVMTGLSESDIVDFEPIPEIEKGFESKPPFAVIYTKSRMKKYMDRLQKIIASHNFDVTEFPLADDRVLAICAEKK